MSKKFSKLISEACKKQGVTNAELARALGRAQSWVPQLFRTDNMLESTFRECVRVLDMELRVELVPMPKARERMTTKKIVEKTGRLGEKSNGRK
jgi:cyanate lyase